MFIVLLLAIEGLDVASDAQHEHRVCPLGSGRYRFLSAVCRVNLSSYQISHTMANARAG